MNIQNTKCQYYPAQLPILLNEMSQAPIRWVCKSVPILFPECESSCHNISVSTGFGLHSDHGCFSQSNTKKCLSWLTRSSATSMYGCCMWNVLLYSSMANFCWLATQQWTSGHSSKNKLAGLLLYTYRYNKQWHVMENKASYWKWPGCSALSIH